MFRMLDENANHASHTSRALGQTGYTSTNKIGSFNPKFDIKETKETYDLNGEWPGIWRTVAAS